jgi:hypothetical protein
MTSVVVRTFLLLALAAASAACASAARVPEPGPSDPTLPPASKIDFFSSGRELSFAVGTRAARLSGPGEFLPLLVLIANTGSASATFDRESFIVQLPDGRMLPLATAEEVMRDHGGLRADRRIAEAFYENVGGAYPSPPFTWIPLDFFPDRHGPIPRDDLGIRHAQVTFGNLYFRTPEGATAEDAWHKLLIRPRGAETTFVVDFLPYRRGR